MSIKEHVVKIIVGGGKIRRGDLLLFSSFSVDGFGGGRASAGALPDDGIVQGDPLAETGRVPVLAVPAEDDHLPLLGSPAAHAGREGAGLIHVPAPSLLDPSGPVAGSQVLPPVDDWALGVEPEELFQLLAHLPGEPRPDASPVRELEGAQIPLGSAAAPPRLAVPGWGQVVVVPDGVLHILGRPIWVKNGLLGLTNGHEPAVKVICSREREKTDRIKKKTFSKRDENFLFMTKKGSSSSFLIPTIKEEKKVFLRS